MMGKQDEKLKKNIDWLRVAIYLIILVVFDGMYFVIFVNRFRLGFSAMYIITILILDILILWRMWRRDYWYNR